MRIARWYVPQGRLSLVQFWMRYNVPFTLAAMGAYVLDEQLGWQERPGPLGAILSYFGGPISALAAVATVVPTIAAILCRLHDRGRTARWLWWLAVPVLGWVMLFAEVWLGPGQPDDNHYGPSPERTRATAVAPREWVA